MACLQLLLVPDPRPLVERLGREFFLRLPPLPGVYLMRDRAGTVLYVGKAKNLRRRISSYRVANPDRLPRRHLRLLRAVEHIDVEVCADETSALLREAELLRSLKPRFNRAGIWPAPPRYLIWRQTGTRVELDVTMAPENQWKVVGPLGGGLTYARAALARLLWRGVFSERGMAGLPHGWVRGRFGGPAGIECGTDAAESSALLEQLFSMRPSPFCGWLQSRVGDGAHPFDRAIMESDLETVVNFFSSEAPGS